MHLSIMSSATPAQAPSWVVAAVAMLLGLIAGRSAMKLWRGDSVFARNSRAQEDRLGFVSVTLIPTSVAFSSVGFGSLALIIRSNIDDAVFSDIMLAVALAMGITFLLCVGIAAELFFIGRPNWLIPPHLRDPSRSDGH